MIPRMSVEDAARWALEEMKSRCFHGTPPAPSEANEVVLVAEKEQGNVSWMRLTDEGSHGLLLAEIAGEGLMESLANFANDKRKVRIFFLENIVSKRPQHCARVGSSCYILCKSLQEVCDSFSRSPSTSLESTANKRRKLEDLMPHLPSLPSDKDALECVQFLRKALHLKREKRTGWVLRGVKEVESVSDHSWGVSLCCLLLNDDSLDWKRATIMSLVHDLSESIVGDMTPDQIEESKKHELEANAMKELLGSFSCGSVFGGNIEKLWKEYEDRRTAEALLVKDLDRFEMLLQADIYERDDYTKDLTEFFVGVRGKILHPVIKSWQEALENERALRLKQRNKGTGTV